VLVCAASVSTAESSEETPLPRSDVSPVLVAVVAEAFSDVEVTSVPFEMVAVAAEEAATEEAAAEEATTEEAAAEVEFADDGKLRTCPTCRSVGTTPGLASSSCCTLTPSAIEIATRVSPDTTVYVPAVVPVVEFACLEFRRVEVYLQTGFASAGNGPEIKEAPTART
jgi:hypothetical protein